MVETCGKSHGHVVNKGNRETILKNLKNMYLGKVTDFLSRQTSYEESYYENLFIKKSFTTKFPSFTITFRKSLCQIIFTHEEKFL